MSSGKWACMPGSLGNRIKRKKKVEQFVSCSRSSSQKKKKSLFKVVLRSCEPFCFHSDELESLRRTKDKIVWEKKRRLLLSQQKHVSDVVRLDYIKKKKSTHYQSLRSVEPVSHFKQWKVTAPCHLHTGRCRTWCDGLETFCIRKHELFHTANNMWVCRLGAGAKFSGDLKLNGSEMI